MRRADVIRTSRDESVFNSVMTKVALLRNTLVLVKINGIIWAGLDACLAPVTQIIIHYDDPIGSLAYRRFGTGVNTGGLIAMPAQINMENKV